MKLVCLLLMSSLFAAPKGFNLLEGDARLSGGHIYSEKNSVIEWESFSVDQQDSLHFYQKDSASFVLNRVKGSLESQILGELLSNGKVYIMNPNGVVIGPDAKIMTGGFIASSFDVLNEELLEDKDLHFFGVGAEVVNLGIIDCPSGDIALLGKRVENQGELRAPQGSVFLGAGFEILLRPSGEERMFIRTGCDEDLAQEHGVEHSGRIEALCAELKAGKNPYKEAIRCSGRIDALSVQEREGRVFLESEDTTVVKGEIFAKSRENKGGRVQILGEDIKILDEAQIDVSGQLGGGELLIGGDYQGKNPQIKNAKTVLVESGVSLKSNAQSKGDGGKIIVWSDSKTHCAASMSATGGISGGNGGFFEVSGKILDFQSVVNAKAFMGQTGTLLLDPTNITISTGGDSGGSFDGGSPNTYTASGNDNVINTTTLRNNLAAASVTINTASAAAQSGSISINNSFSWTEKTTLTLNAEASILCASGVTVSNTHVDTDFTAMDFSGIANNATSGRGIQITGNLSSVGGGISLTATQGTSGLIGIEIVGTVSTQDGAITFDGTGSNGTGGCCEWGIIINTGSSVTVSGAGSINMTGQGGPSDCASEGIAVLGSITIGNGDSFMTGTAGNGTSNQRSGIAFSNSGSITLNGSGNLTMTGFGGASSTGSQSCGTPPNHGVSFIDTTSISTSLASTGDLIINGTGGSSPSSITHYGVFIDSGVTTSFSGSGNISITGVGGTSNVGGHHGIVISKSLSSSGAMSFDGTGGAANSGNDGIHVDGAIVASNGVTLAGTAGAGSGSFGTSIAGDITTSGGNITVTGSSILATSAILDTTNSGAAPSGANISFSGSGATIEGTAAGTETLTLLGGTSGAVELGGAIGASTRLGSLTVTSAKTTSDAVTIGGNITANAFSILTNSPSTLNTTVAIDTSAANGAISFGGTIDGLSSGSQGLTLTSGSGAVTLSSSVGSTTSLASLSITSSNSITQGVSAQTTGTISYQGSSISLGGSVTTSGNTITMTGPIGLAAAVSLDSTNSGAVSTGATITCSGAITNTQDLTIRAGSVGTISLGGDLGTSITPLNTLTITSASLLDLAAGVDIFLNNAPLIIPPAITINGDTNIDTGSL